MPGRASSLFSRFRRRSEGTPTLSVPAPLHSDWSWRPQPWAERLEVAELPGALNKSRLGRAVALFHDGREAAIDLRQAGAAAPFAVELVLHRFDGGFVSLAVDLPRAGIAGLRRRHVLRVETRIAAAPDAEAFARLNVRNGPNTEQITRPLSLQGAEVIEFELFHTELDDSRVEAAWLDLIFVEPGTGRIVLSDLTLSRRPRAEV